MVHVNECSAYTATSFVTGLLAIYAMCFPDCIVVSEKRTITR